MSLSYKTMRKFVFKNYSELVMYRFKSLKAIDDLPPITAATVNLCHLVLDIVKHYRYLTCSHPANLKRLKAFIDEFYYESFTKSVERHERVQVEKNVEKGLTILKNKAMLKFRGFHGI